MGDVSQLQQQQTRSSLLSEQHENLGLELIHIVPPVAVDLDVDASEVAAVAGNKVRDRVIGLAEPIVRSAVDGGRRLACWRLQARHLTDWVEARRHLDPAKHVDLTAEVAIDRYIAPVRWLLDRAHHRPDDVETRDEHARNVRNPRLPPYRRYRVGLDGDQAHGVIHKIDPCSTGAKFLNCKPSSLAGLCAIKASALKPAIFLRRSTTGSQKGFDTPVLKEAKALLVEMH
jgi:hypothetical protein